MKELSKHERIQQRLKEVGRRKDRKREKHSDKFNRMFSFFNQIIRKEICDFCGSDVQRDYKVIFDINGVSAKFAFKEYENGDLENYTIVTRHPNLIINVIRGKRGLGLWFDQWSDGIVDGTFTKFELLEEFRINGIEIPESYMIELENLICRKRYNSEINQEELYLLDKDFKLKLYNDKKI